MAEVWVSIDWEGNEEAVKRLLLNLVYNIGDYDTDEYGDLDELFNHVNEQLKAGKCSDDFQSSFLDLGWGFQDFYLKKNNISIEGASRSYLGMLMELCDASGGFVSNHPGLEIIVYCDGERFCGLEYFRFVNGKLVEQWFENDRQFTGVWTPCIISWKGDEKAVSALLEDIITENEGCDDFFEPDQQYWLGKRISLEHYYEETGPYMRCAICDGEIMDTQITFDAFCDDSGEKEEISKFFDALAAAHPELEFTMKMCSGSFSGGDPSNQNDDDWEYDWIKTFYYQNGSLTNEEKSEDPKDGFYTKIRDRYYRYSIDLVRSKNMSITTEKEAIESLKDGMLYDVPVALRTFKVCLEAIKTIEDPDSLNDLDSIPVKMIKGELLKTISEKLVDFAKAGSVSGGSVLSETPRRFLTKKLCILAVNSIMNDEDDYERGDYKRWIIDCIPNKYKEDVTSFAMNHPAENNGLVEAKEVEVSFEEVYQELIAKFPNSDDGDR